MTHEDIDILNEDYKDQLFSNLLESFLFNDGRVSERLQAYDRIVRKYGFCLDDALFMKKKNISIRQYIEEYGFIPDKFRWKRPPPKFKETSLVKGLYYSVFGEGYAFFEKDNGSRVHFDRDSPYTRLVESDFFGKPIINVDVWAYAVDVLVFQLYHSLPLIPGLLVYHLDGNYWNNNPSNLCLTQNSISDESDIYYFAPDRELIQLETILGRYDVNYEIIAYGKTWFNKVCYLYYHGHRKTPCGKVGEGSDLLFLREDGGFKVCRFRSRLDIHYNRINIYLSKLVASNRNLNNMIRDNISPASRIPIH